MDGVVYILENLDAQRVKVGMTINAVELRLRDANDMWQEHKITCQICGGRRLVRAAWSGPKRMPRHVVSGIRCPGEGAAPLEADTSLAAAHLQNLRLQLQNASGTQKGSLVRQINTLESRIRMRSEHVRGVGAWRVAVVFETPSAERVERLAHDLLGEHLDQSAPFGEVFRCSTATARTAVENALAQLGVLHLATEHGQSAGRRRF